MTERRTNVRTLSVCPDGHTLPFRGVSGPVSGALTDTSTASTPNAKTAAPRLLSVQDVADETGLSVWTVRDLIGGGALPRVELPGVRRVLVDRRDLERAIEAWKVR
jgi:excisionase family DNA binding protein